MVVKRLGTIEVSMICPVEHLFGMWLLPNPLHLPQESFPPHDTISVLLYHYGDVYAFHLEGIFDGEVFSTTAILMLMSALEGITAELLINNSLKNEK